jgi:hypothetical protein
MRRGIRIALVTIADGLLLVGTAAVLAISLSGGATFAVAGRSLSAHSTGWSANRAQPVIFLVRIALDDSARFLDCWMSRAAWHSRESGRLGSVLARRP